ncbi:MAG: enoyl-ACP reductase [Armatimonadota bacterium]|nr:enoyl-ACP reductase [Armatimonadota bacterium]MDR7440327.1 enoyl-ACP reductase [Armatimonadota bacterium]MDR7562762.1 enoyl-ACP reductase [Armatimonadota bacterium]MDR7568264.1 enoyl-ACP reductase [Armatimonadota bacterium]MDR7602947.1 enoyl-ACP reductase [Armatimonadota bacterium]
MSGLLAGKNALVMGVANRWSIAWGIARALHREGARCLLTYLGEREADTVRKLAEELGGARALACDVSREGDLQSLQQALQEDPGEVHVLVHSIAYARTEDLRGSFLDTSREGYLVAQEVSAYSLVACARALAPLMPSGSSILTLTFAASSRVYPNYNVMAPAKAALECIVRYLAYELGPRGIRVNAISAGPIKTASARAVAGFTEFLRAYTERAPLRRAVEAEDVGDVAVFLASDLSRVVTGQVLFADAGYHVLGV